MQIWIDADACPKAVKEILYRTARRTKLNLTLVANRPLQVPDSRYINTIMVKEGFDVADEEIVERTEPGDVIITEDVPLAAAVIGKGAVVITPRGKLLDRNNIGEHLSIRNFMDELRGAGVETSGPAPRKSKDTELFANQLHKIISSMQKLQPGQKRQNDKNP